MEEGGGHGAGDRISSLPDDILFSILLRIGSTRAAARTSVLSRRWRHVWARLPELRLGTCDEQPGATLLDSVDAALDACSAPAVQRLEVAMYCHGLRVHARRVALWLRFASQRRVGDLYIEVPSQMKFFLSTKPRKEELELPVCDGAARITLSLERQWRLCLCPAGSFMLLTDLHISCATMEGSELGALVSKQCPRLRNLYLFVRLAAASNVSIRSDSLDSLSFDVENTEKLEVIAPKLEVLTVCDATKADISAPKLAEISWDGDTGYDPQCHRFGNAGRRLRLLDLGSKCVVASLMHRFDKVDVLKLNLNLCNFKGTEAYTNFLNETIALPKCEKLKLRVSLRGYDHSFASSMFHLLRSCNSTRKVSIKIDSGHLTGYPCPFSCYCRWPESCKADGITLESLEEVKITFIRNSYGQVQFVEELARGHAPSLKKLVINCDLWSDGSTQELQEKVGRMFDPDVIVECNVI
ncbi:F-box/FBD/LRR-repeat protein At5g22660-like isoform X2 [Miscanthus floridulus]|uniref:F-box/FBD/LRR-repeat protein At5g22660-like isoform X2 n=1 Tax=Miscanthus floridulus TaxID=154761 RepID=UPI00345A4B96